MIRARFPAASVWRLPLSLLSIALLNIAASQSACCALTTTSIAKPFVTSGLHPQYPSEPFVLFFFSFFLL
uniref:Putative secreted protein n=1 Tax=Anopheles darlingi TaxID=43151 RepID=A0A2M4DG90_ANODA